MTNADKIRSMSDEELAEYIVKFHFRLPFNCEDKCDEGVSPGCGFRCHYGEGWHREWILEWLKEECNNESPVVKVDPLCIPIVTNEKEAAELPIMDKK